MALVEDWILLALYWGALALHVAAFIDATIRPNAGYVANERLTKPAWMGITALAAVVTYLSGPISFLGIPALVASIVYFVDVRPALRGTSQGEPLVDLVSMSDHAAGRTERLDLADATLREWEATVLASDLETGIVLDRSAFYPGGGGQPPDHGVLLWGGVETRILDCRRGDDLYLIPADGDPIPPVGTAVRGAIEDARRSSLMRTHSGLHLLAGVVFRDFGALVTGGNMEPGVARMDFNLPDIPPDFKDRIAQACAVEVAADRAIRVENLPVEQAMAIPDIIRTATNLLPPDLELVRIVDIVGLDVQADGGTHVASTKQIGGMEVVKVENKGKANRRLRVRLTD